MLKLNRKLKEKKNEHHLEANYKIKYAVTYCLETKCYKTFHNFCLKFHDLKATEFKCNEKLRDLLLRKITIPPKDNNITKS